MNLKIWDKIGDWVVLVGLIAVSGVFTLTKNEPAVRGLRAQTLEIAASIESRLAWVGGFVRALEENEQLRADNIRLSSLVARSREDVIENDRLRSLLDLRDTLAVPTLAARIISKDLTRQRNLLTIDVGREDGVEIGMAVVDEHGIIGKVVLVSGHYARVMPYLNTDLRIPAKVQPNQAPGIVRWTGERRDQLLMEHVVKTVPVRRGQVVVASGHSQVFQAGYPVGVVDSVIVRPGRIELLLLLTPSANLEEAEHVFVVLARPDNERAELESAVLR